MLTFGFSTLPVKTLKHFDELGRSPRGKVVAVMGVHFEVPENDKGLCLTKGFAQVFKERFGCEVWICAESGIPLRRAPSQKTVFKTQNYPVGPFICGQDTVELYVVKKKNTTQDYILAGCDPEYANLFINHYASLSHNYVHVNFGLGVDQSASSVTNGPNYDFVQFPTFYDNDHECMAKTLDTVKNGRHSTKSANAVNRKVPSQAARFWKRQADRIAEGSHRRRKDPLYCARVYNNTRVLLGPEIRIT
jgi:hypothetical protein